MSTLIGHARVQAAIHHVCAAFGVTKAQIMALRGPERISWPRQVAIALAYYTADLGQAELAWIFKRSVHAVRRSVSVVRNRAQVDSRTRVCFRRLRRAIEHETFG